MRAQIGITELKNSLTAFLQFARSGETTEEYFHFRDRYTFNKIHDSLNKVCESCTVDEDDFALCTSFGLVRRAAKFMDDIEENNYQIPGYYVLYTWLPLLSEVNDHIYRLTNMQDKRFSYFKLIKLYNGLNCPIVLKYFHPVERVNSQIDVMNNYSATLAATSSSVFVQFEIEDLGFESEVMKINIPDDKNEPIFRLEGGKGGFRITLNEYSD